jgi:microcompartment protein CcmL/EutN
MASPIFDTIGIVELNNICRGVETCDIMLKKADVVCLNANPVCPGKYVITVAGQVADVNAAADAAKNMAGEFLLDITVIPRLSKSIFSAISGTSDVSPEKIDALGMVESFSVPSIVIAADLAVKAAGVLLIEVRLGMGLGGKSVMSLCGPVGEVEAAIKAASKILEKQGALVGRCIIPSPHKELKKLIV